MSNQSTNRFHTQNAAWQSRLQGLELASFRSRAAAFVFDAVLVSALGVGLRSLFGSGSFRVGESVSFEFELGGTLIGVVALAYFTIATYLGNGATLGKRLCGIRVISLVHSRLSLWHCVERCLGYAASSLEAGFGFIQYFTHPNRQTVHDRIAETIVIVHRHPGHVENAQI